MSTRVRFLALLPVAMAAGCGSSWMSASFPEIDGLPLHRAAASGDRDALTSSLHKGISTESRDRSGRTPLHWAARQGQVQMIHALLAAHASVDPRDRDLRTPLSYGATQTDVIEALVAAGANVNALDAMHETPLVDAARAQLSGRAVRLMLDAAGLASVWHMP